MIRNNLICGVIVLVFLSLTSCEAIFEKNISKTKPKVLTPFDGSEWQSGTISIKWNEIKGATDYELLLVTPSFEQTDYFVMDCTFVSTEVLCQLYAGEYELKVRGSNSAYKSKWSEVVKFDVSGEEEVGVSLLSPNDQSWVNNNFSGMFSWSGFADAIAYVISFREGGSFDTGNIIFQTQIDVNEYVFTDIPTYTANDKLFWGVKAIFVDGETDFSSSTLNIDLTSPDTASLVSPDNDSTFSNSDQITFNWVNYQNVNEFESDISALIQVAEDSSFINQVVFHQGEIENFEMETPSSGTYYWRVMNIDEAGNFGPYTNHRKFIIP